MSLCPSIFAVSIFTSSALNFDFILFASLFARIKAEEGRDSFRQIFYIELKVQNIAYDDFTGILRVNGLVLDAKPLEFIELNSFLKVKGVAVTGGMAKLIIRAGSVTVNGEIETRNKKKLRAGDVVECLEKKFIVEEALLR